jgi:hypothetical protein
VNQKISEQFYPLTPERSEKLLAANLTAAQWRLWCYLIKLDPWGERYVELPDTLTICSECQIKKSTFYTAIAKFQKLGLFDFQDKGFSCRNLKGIPKIRKTFPKIGNDSGKLETIPKIRKTFQEIGNDSEKLENQSPEPVPDKFSDSPQTLQTLQTNQTLQTEEGEGKKTFSLEKNEQENQAASLQVGSQKSEVGSQNRELEVENTEGSRGKCATQEVPSQRKKKIPQELINKLEELEIPLDKAVRSALANHHLSQAYGAAAHVERTWSTIDNPRAIFLYQLPKQPVEKAPKGLNQEFLDWYKSAVAEGIVENLPPQHLPTSCYNEPLVRLKRPDPITGAPYTLVEWRRVQLEPDYDPNPKIASLKKVSSLEELKELLEQLRQEKLGNDA